MLFEWLLTIVYYRKYDIFGSFGSGVDHRPDDAERPSFPAAISHGAIAGRSLLCNVRHHLTASSLISGSLARETRSHLNEPKSPMSVNEDVRRTLLLTTLHDVNEAPTFLAAPVAEAARRTTESLQILIISSAFDSPTSNERGNGEPSGVSRTASWDAVQRLLTFAYVQATSIAQELGRVLLDIDVLLKGAADLLTLPEDVIQEAERIYTGMLPNMQSALSTDTVVRCAVTPPDASLPALSPALDRRRADFIALEPDSHHVHHSPHPPDRVQTDGALQPVYPVVALGGTFDHLHAGHKILLSVGAWIASEKLIIGITGTPVPTRPTRDPPPTSASFSLRPSDDVLLVKKEFKEVLEPLPVRISRTRAFLERFKPGLVYDLVPIDDVYGPTGWDPNIQALVVSKETLSGASSSESTLFCPAFVIEWRTANSREEARGAWSAHTTDVCDRCDISDGGQPRRGGRDTAQDREDEQYLHPRVDREKPDPYSVNESGPAPIPDYSDDDGVYSIVSRHAMCSISHGATEFQPLSKIQGVHHAYYYGMPFIPRYVNNPSWNSRSRRQSARTEMSRRLLRIQMNGVLDSQQ